MAASDSNPPSDRPAQVGAGCLAPEVLRERLEEEIGRAERHGTLLSCLLVVIEDLDQIAREHGRELCEQTVQYVAGALQGELRSFDRVGRIQTGGSRSDGELLIILPGADSPRGEIVARRALERLGTIKLETHGTRHPLHVSIGLAAWRLDSSADSLLTRARAAMRSANGEHANGLAPGSSAAADTPPAQAPPAVDPIVVPPAVGRLRGQ
jgi:diguanylate cyclase (GGDEF)-like protein